ncbi:MAG: c-type cytochrome [Pigmentiphaga sp.]|nr:c-type cytochrome [Pigmentiphaga sp.]
MAGFRWGFIVVLVVVLAAGIGMVFWQSLPSNEQMGLPPVGSGPLAPIGPASDGGELLARGQAVYMAQCASCHGDQLQGQPAWRERRADGRLPAPPHDASGHTWHHPDAQLFAMIKYGIGPVAGIADYPSDMPAYEGILSDQDITAVVAWIKSQWPAEIRQQHDQINRQASQMR